MYLFFDLDGVLADFCNLHKEAFITAWNSLMIEYPIQNDFYNLYFYFIWNNIFRSNNL